MDTQTQIDRLIELAIIQRTELKQLVEQLPQLREHLNAEVEKVFEETEPQLRSELEEWTTKQTADKTAALGVALEAKIANLAKSLEISTQARYSAIIAEREENARLAAQAEAKIAEHAASLPSAVKEIVSAELARFPRAGEIDQLRKEFAEPRGLNPRGKWQAGETYNRLDLVTYNGDSFVSNIDGNTEKPSRNAANWTLNAARGAYGGGGGITSLNDVLNAPTSGQIIGSQNGQYVPKTLVAGANITINETASSITIIGDEGQISLQDGTAAAPSLFFTNDTDTGIYRPAANTLGISVSGTQVAYFDVNGITTVGAGATFDGSVHAANGNANNPSLSFTSDDNTGFFRHQPDEIGITLGGTQKATLTSTTFSITPNLSTSGNLTVSGGTVDITSANSAKISGSTAGSSATLSLISNTVANYRSLQFGYGATPTYLWTIGYQGATSNDQLNFQSATGTVAQLTQSGALTLSSNLTVSGGKVLISYPSSSQARVSFGGAHFDANSSYASYIRGYSSGATTAGLDFYTTYGSSVLALSLSEQGNATLAGSLTVSGSIVNQNGVIQSTLAAGALISSLSTNNNAVHGFQISGSGTGSRDWRLEQGRAGANSFSISNATGGLTTPLIVNGATNNILIGFSSASSDGGQKLQVAGTGIFSSTESAVTLYATASGGYAYQLISGGNLGHALGAFKIYDSSTGYVVLNHDKPTSGGTRLSFDGAGNATFAGTVTTAYLNSTGGSAFNQFGSGTRTKTALSGASGEVAFDNGTVDSPGVHFYTGNNANYGIDATASSGLRIIKNLDEAGGTVVTSFTDTAATFAVPISSVATGRNTFGGTLAVTGVSAGNATSTGILDFSSGATRLLSFGANASTRGTLSVIGLSSDSSLNTTLLTVSSASAVFSGTISPQQAATASAPTYVKGAIYFDTTLNKLRVGGATGWETITSV